MNNSLREPVVITSNLAHKKGGVGEGGNKMSTTTGQKRSLVRGPLSRPTGAKSKITIAGEQIACSKRGDVIPGDFPSLRLKRINHRRTEIGRWQSTNAGISYPDNGKVVARFCGLGRTKKNSRSLALVRILEYRLSETKRRKTSVIRDIRDGEEDD